MNDQMYNRYIQGSCCDHVRLCKTQLPSSGTLQRRSHWPALMLEGNSKLQLQQTGGVALGGYPPPFH